MVRRVVEIVCPALHRVEWVDFSELPARMSWYAARRVEADAFDVDDEGRNEVEQVGASWKNEGRWCWWADTAPEEAARRG